MSESGEGREGTRRSLLQSHKAMELPRSPLFLFLLLLFLFFGYSLSMCARQKVAASARTGKSIVPSAKRSGLRPLISSSSSSFHPHFPIDLDGLRSGPYRLL